jgi:RNA polymerase sigma-70 factor (ECF subfamily)
MTQLNVTLRKIDNERGANRNLKRQCDQPEQERGIAVNSSEKALCGHIQGLRRYALALVRNPAEADDLVQECLVRALARPASSSPIRDLQAYLFTILHNVRADQLRQHAKRSGPLVLEQLSAASTSPPRQDLHLECRDMVEALGRLPESQRQAILLIGVGGLPYEDAAEILDVPVGTIMSRLSRGRDSLRRMMAGEAPLTRRRVSLARVSPADRSFPNDPRARQFRVN